MITVPGSRHASGRSGRSRPRVKPTYLAMAAAEQIDQQQQANLKKPSDPMHPDPQQSNAVADSNASV